jgi:hypothetical protein
MNLKTFTPDTVGSSMRKTKSPTIAINMKVGLFRINEPACELIGLKGGDYVVFHQEEGEEGNWYIEKVKGSGFEVREKETVGKGVLFNNTGLAKQIAASVAFEGTSGKVLVAGQPTVYEKRKLFGVLTGTLRNV